MVCSPGTVMGRMGEQCSTHREVRTKGPFIYEGNKSLLDLGRDARMILK
jgi:hypothetical protein